MRVPDHRTGDGRTVEEGRVPGAARPRVTGVDVARGVALLGMMAVHVFDTFDEGGSPSATTVIAGGRSAATFALVAGVSLAFLSGGRRVVQGRARSATAAGLAVRALLIGAIGLLLGLTETGIAVILVFYAVLFLLAIPLIGLPPRTLALLTAVVIAVGPLLLVVAARMDPPDLDGDNPNPTFVTMVTEPAGTLGALFIAGVYPVVVYLAYLCAGLAIGRLDLGSRHVAAWLLGGGIALAVASRIASSILLYPVGGLDRLVAQGEVEAEDASAAMTLLWEPEQGTSWWYLALASPHSHTQLDLTHTLGAAMAVLGASLLLTRVPAIGRLLGPVEAAGAMTLTLYTAHILVLETGAFEDHLTVQYLFVVAASLSFALLWRRWQNQGPLERMVAVAAGRARRAVLAEPARVQSPAGDR